MDTYDGLPPELKAMNSAMDMVFGALEKPETREAMIARWEKEGRLDPNCPGCKEFYDSPRLPSDVFAPRHKASREGHRAHCTCDSCFTALLALLFSPTIFEAIHAGLQTL